MKTANNGDPSKNGNISILVTENNRLSSVKYEMKSRYVDILQEVTATHLTVAIHSHDFYEVLYCHNPAGGEYLVAAERYRLQKGDIVFIPPGVPHCPILPDQLTEAYRRDVIRINKDFVHSLLVLDVEQAKEDSFSSFLVRTGGTHWEHLGELFQQSIQESEEKNVGWELTMMANTAKLLVSLYRAFTEQATGPAKAEKPELLDQVLEYIEEHMHQKISLAEVARHFYVSQSTITQTFRNKLGLSFYRCVTQRRLVSAKQMIEGDKALEAIAEAVGFTDYSAFYRAFKQEYGISPRQYRMEYHSDR